MRDPVIFLSVAEDSADEHAASLVAAARERWPGATFYGLTGPRTRALGVKPVAELTGQAAMLTGSVRLIRRAWEAVRATEEAWRRRRPDLVVLLDSPELNLRLARRAKRAGLRVLYYIAPQTWASREGRLHAMRSCIDHLACILPFEEPYFRSAGIPATYVGHPLFDRAVEGEGVKTPRLDGHEDAVAEHPARNPGGARGLVRLGLFPGSRSGLLARMLPLQLDIAEGLQRALDRPLEVRVSCVDERRAGLVSGALDAWRQRCGNAALRVRLCVDDNAAVVGEADLLLVTSGTVTLQAARSRKPMIVLYDAGWLAGWLYDRLGSRLITTPHLSLLNVLVGARIVPEFMPTVPDIEAVVRVAKQLLTDRAWREQMISDLDRVMRSIERPGASRRVCDLMAELLSAR